MYIFNHNHILVDWNHIKLWTVCSIYKRRLFVYCYNARKGGSIIGCLKLLFLGYGGWLVLVNVVEEIGLIYMYRVVLTDAICATVLKLLIISLFFLNKILEQAEHLCFLFYYVLDRVWLIPIGKGNYSKLKVIFW